MDVNLVFVGGRLAVPADLEWLPDGSRRGRLLVCVRSERRSRFDVLRVIVPPDVWSDSLATAQGGARVWVVGHLMRRYSQDPCELTGLIEVIAAAITFPDLETVDRSNQPCDAASSAFDVEDGTGSR